MRRPRRFIVVLGLFATAFALIAPIGEAAPSSSGSTSSCPLPPTELCTDHLFLRGKWGSGPIVYYVNERDAPAGFSQAVEAGFEQWESEIKSEQVEAAYPGARSGIDFQYGGTTTRSPAKLGDGFNVVGFSQTNTWCEHCAWVSRKTKGGRIVEADIQWATSLGAPSDVFMTDVTCPTLDCNKYDIHSIAAHEVGHVLGLAHVDAEADLLLVMYPGTKRNELQDRTLGAGEVLGVRALYPAA